MSINLDALTLAKGAHDDRDDGLCLMEAVAWFAGESHTDHPACVSPVLGIYGRALNDALPDYKRQALKSYIPRLAGTADDGQDKTRSYLALDWLIRVYVPAWLESAGLDQSAASLRELPRITNPSAARTVMQTMAAAGAAAWDAAGAAAGAAAGDAAWDAAWDAAGDAAWDAAWAAAWAAAGDAAGAAAWAAAWAAIWDAAGAAAWAAAWDAARDAAGAAARDAAWDAARDAARAAAWDAAWDAARAAAWAAAWAALVPVVSELQDSAIRLLADMIHPGGGS